ASINAQQPLVSLQADAGRGEAAPTFVPGQGAAQELLPQPAPPVFPSASGPDEAGWPPTPPPESVERAPSLPLQQATADRSLIWGRAAFLLWWVKTGPAPPPLVPTGPASAVSPGVIGQPDTTVVIGERPIDYGTFSGGRFSVGAWFNLHQSLGLEVTGLV